MASPHDGPCPRDLLQRPRVCRRQGKLLENRGLTAGLTAGLTRFEKEEI